MSGYSNLSDNNSKHLFDRDAWGVTTIGLLFTSIITSILLGIFFQSGLGKFSDGFFGFLLSLFCLVIGAFFSFLVVRLLNILPSFFKVTLGAVLFTLLVFVFIRQDIRPGFLFFTAFTLIILQGFLAGLIWAMLSGRLRFVLYSKRIWARLFVFAIILIDIGVYYLFAAYNQVDSASYTPRLDKKIIAALPKDSTASFRISSFYYGSGNDKRRTTYQNGVAFNTESVNIAQVLPELEPNFSKAYKWFWGFDATQLPLNAQVWLPEADSLSHELVLIIHGNESLTSDLENGFAYLGESLSKMGYMVVIPDLNFFNDFWLRLPQKGKLNAKALIVQNHLEALDKWSNDPAHELFGKLDSNRVATIVGHGDGALVAREMISLSKVSKLPYNAQISIKPNFTINKIVELAPENVSGKNIIPINDIDHLAIHAGYDAVNTFHNFDPHVGFVANHSYNFSNSVSLYKANYAQFNEVLEGRDLRPPYNWLINQSAIMSGKQQRKLTSDLIGFFLKCSSGQYEWLPIMYNTYYLKDIPKDVISYNQFKDNRQLDIANFEEDVNPETLTFDKVNVTGSNLKIWKELDYLPNSTNSNKGLLLGWDASDLKNLSQSMKKEALASWDINLLPDFNKDLQLGNNASFIFSMLYLGTDITSTELESFDQNNITDDIDFSIELIDSIGIVNRIAFKNFASAAIPLSPKLYKVSGLRTNKTNMFFQTYSLSLNRFSGLNPDFDINTLAKIRFVFDKTKKGKILIDNVGFRRSNTQIKKNEDTILESER